MVEKIRFLQASISQQLQKMEKSRHELITYLATVDQVNVSTYNKITIGYYLHNFYNGCESIFVLIARTFENNLDEKKWHQDLLQRMTLEIKGVRPAIISDKLCNLLDNFRGFRHVFRHGYSFELDWDREKLVMEKFSEASDLFEAEMNSFLRQLDSIVEE